MRRLLLLVESVAESSSSGLKTFGFLNMRRVSSDVEGGTGGASWRRLGTGLMAADVANILEGYVILIGVAALRPVLKSALSINGRLS